MVKLSLSRAWDEAKAVIRTESRLIAAVALAFFVLPQIVLWASMPETPVDQLPPPGPWIAVLLIVLLVSLLAQLALTRMSMEPHISVGEAVGHGARRLLPLFGALLLWTIPMTIVGAILYSFAALNPSNSMGIALTALVLLCVLTIAAVYLAVRFMLTPAVAAAENGNPLQLLRRSFEVTRGNWWRLFAFLIVFALAAGVLIKVAELVTGLIAVGLTGDTGRLTIGGLVVAIVVQLVSALVSVTFVVMLARIYLQLAGRESLAVGVPKSGI